MIHIFLNYIIDPATRHFRLFFDDTWHSLSDHVSYGHDIEGSWLLFEAAQVLGDAVVLERVRLMAERMADAVLAEGLGAQGGILYERSPEGVDDDFHWWAQAEGLPGFYNAYQISGRPEFAEAAYRLWEYILAQFVDRERGEWFRIVHRDGTPDLSQLKIGPWECPYHNSRACMEMLARLARP